jgi:haloalkane dehalogenase
MVLQNNYFIEEILPNAILRKLSDEEMAEYRRPFAEPGEGRRPTLTWPRQIPIEGEPADVTAIATEYADWLGRSNVPKLFLKIEPGAILANDRLVNLVRGWPALTEKTVAGIHFVQEDSPDEIGRAIAGWMRTLGCRGPCSATMAWRHGIPSAPSRRAGGCADQACLSPRSGDDLNDVANQLIARHQGRT